MGFFKNLFFGRKKEYEEQSYDEENGQIDSEVINMRDKEERRRYVDNCLEQIEEASRELEQLTEEYNLVTTYLTDMEEIEALPEQEREQLRQQAQKIVELSQSRENYLSRKDRMRESDYNRMQRMENEVQEGYRKLKNAEDYQALIRQDLQRLDRERNSCQFQQKQWRATVENTRGMAIICLVAVALCLGMLAVLQLGFGMDTQIGYLITAGAAAIAITLIYAKHLDAKAEVKRTSKTLNRLILLQNKVKIRYINNTNLLEYLRLKYEVERADELNDLWNRYVKEKEEREALELAEDDLAFYNKEMLRTLYHYQLQIPDIWPGQALALVDNREMVEIRHGLIQQRQSLRKRMEYNQGLAENAKQIIKEVAHDYPQDADEILKKVSDRT
jgi:hypothetical protein